MVDEKALDKYTDSMNSRSFLSVSHVVMNFIIKEGVNKAGTG
jgi:hypothetical protein